MKEVGSIPAANIHRVNKHAGVVELVYTADLSPAVLRHASSTLVTGTYKLTCPAALTVKRQFSKDCECEFESHAGHFWLRFESVYTLGWPLGERGAPAVLEDDSAWG